MTISGLVNYNEEIVRHYLELLLNDRSDICGCQQCRLDMLAYACNRVQPRYIVSERGHTHAFLDRHSAQNQADIMGIVSKSVEIVSKRARHFHGAGQEAVFPNTAHEDESSEEYFYNFPHIVGRVRDLNSGAPLVGAVVTAFVNGTKAWLNDDSWANPYTTIDATQGAFSFWPASEKADTFSRTEKFNISILIECKDYISIEKSFTVKINPEKRKYRFLRSNQVYIIPAIHLE
jgi:competence protein ComFB